MIAPMHLSQILSVDVCVDLCRGDVRVTEHLLNRAQVSAPLQQMGGERMSQRVRRDVFRDPGTLHILRENLPRSHARQRRAASVEKQRASPRAWLQLRPELAHVDRKGAYRATSDGHQALLAALAEDAHEALV